MNLFYAIMIALGNLATIGLAVIVHTSTLPWWKWPVFLGLMILVEFGCFATRDRHNEKKS